MLQAPTRHRLRSLVFRLALTGLMVAWIEAPPASATFAGSNGSVAFVGWIGHRSQKNYGIYSIRPDGSHRRLLIRACDLLSDAGGTFVNPFYSAGGEHIVFAQRPCDPAAKGSNRGIESMRADGSGVRLLLAPKMRGGSQQPAYSPSRRWIAFSNGNYNVGRLFKMRADGSRLTVLLHRFAGVGTPLYPTWLPNGRRIAFSGTQATGIFTIRPDGSDFRQLSSFGVARSLSPNGRRIAYVTYDQVSDREAIHTALRDGSETRLVRLEGKNMSISTPQYSPNGRRIVYIRYSYSPNYQGGQLRTVSVGSGDVRGLASNLLPTVSALPSWQARPSAGRAAPRSRRGRKLTTGPKP